MLYYLSSPCSLSVEVRKFVDGVKMNVVNRWWDDVPVRTSDMVTHDMALQCVGSVLTIKNILDADVFVLLMLSDTADYSDCLLELGVALGKGIPCFVYNPSGARVSTSYFNHPFIHTFEVREDLLRCIGC